MEGLSRPSRSDPHLSKDEENKIEEETREHFQELAPKRHTKPQRSEYSSKYVDVNHSVDNVIPEYLEFQRLETDNEKIEKNSGDQVTEEFVETEYYKDLNCTDKQHHTTGTGFIKMEDSKGGKSYNIAPDSDFTHHASSNGNPATNDWIPSTDDQVDLVSDKPHQSHN